MLNRDYFIPRGFLVALYIDDDNGQTALGWGCIPVDIAEEIGIIPWNTDVVDRREAAFDSFEC